MSMGVVYTRGTINKNVMTTDHRYTEGGKRRFPGSGVVGGDGRGVYE